MDNYYYYPFTGSHPVRSPFGPRVIDGVPGYHYGVDFGWNLDEGSHFTVCAAAPGRVIYFADEGLGGGRTMTVRHEGGEQSRYYHLDHPLVDVGAEVALHQPIAISGETGGVAPHLHFEIHDKRGTAVDPLPLLQTWDATPEPTPPTPAPPTDEETPDMYWMRSDDQRLGAVFENVVDVFLPNTYSGDPSGGKALGVSNDVFNYIVSARHAE